MPSRDQVIPVDDLLTAARQRVSDAGLRVAAGEIGIEFSTLSKLLSGDRSPRSSTRRKLTTWYLARAQAGELEDPAELLGVAFTILAAFFPEPVRVQVRTKFATEFDQVARAHGVALPHAAAVPHAARKKDVPGGS